MPKKQQQQGSQAEQSERFIRETRRLIDAGELSPVEAGDRFDQAVRGVAHKQFRRPEGGETSD